MYSMQLSCLRILFSGLKTLSSKCTKNYCNWTVHVPFIKGVLTVFLRHSLSTMVWCVIVCTTDDVRQVLVCDGNVE